jgi:thiol:disulfide interchange protein
MLTIAGGIILAVLFFALLPYLIVALGWLIGIGLCVAAVGAVIYMLGQADAATWGALSIAVGIALILGYLYAKAPKKPQMPEEEFRLRYPYLSAKLNRQRAANTSKPKELR